ncbi:MAG TPA: response regulator [Gemmataceae bacterium]|nr:response regulator [Gemmataceae bacterium]
MATILVVDDRAGNREFLVTLLGYAGHRLLGAGDGAEALALAANQHPDLVITDILMPTMDGYEFVRQLRADPNIAATPVIFYTAHYLERTARRLASAGGVVHVLTKPCEPEVILRTVEAALQGDTPLAPSSSSSREAFDRDHLRLVTDKLSQKVDELRRVNARLNALIDLGLDLASQRDPQRLLRNFCHATRRLLAARYAVVGILNGEGRQLIHCFTSGMDSATAARLGSLESSQGVLGVILRDRRCYRWHNARGESPALGLPTAFPAAQSFLGAPIVSPERVQGWLCLIDKLGGEEFTSEDERLAGILAAQLGRIYENDNLYTEASRHAAKLETEIVERKHLEEQFRQSQRRLQQVVDSSPVVLFTRTVTNDRLQGISWISDNLLEILGYRPEAALEPGWWAGNLHAEDRDKTIAQANSELFSQGRTQIEYRLRHGDGSYRWIRGELRLTRDAAGQPLEAVGSWSDITEHKNLEEQYRQAQKMEAVGRLAGGICHDFNNLLTIINGYSDMLLNFLRKGDPMQEFAEQIHKAGERASALTRQLLAFSRKMVLQPEVLDLKALMADMGKMLRRLIGEDIDLKIVSDPNLWRVKADPGQMEQVILNLCVNARDAMPHGGKLIVETHNVELDGSYSALHPDTPAGQYVLLAVSDTGHGMDAATKARIFEPFFTTKEAGKGTGLGLAIVHGIVKQSGGQIQVYSELGVGTTFKIYLPRVQQPAVGRKSHPGVVRLRRGTETVLLVEDDDGVRALTRTILERSGYRVLEARNGGEALLLCEQHQGPIHLLVSDVIMPQMSGGQLAERLASLLPTMKVLFMSGYTDDAILHHGSLEAEAPFLHKPFSPEALAQKVREVLDGDENWTPLGTGAG